MSGPYQPPQQEDPYQQPKQAGPYQAPQGGGRYPGAQYPGAQYDQSMPASQQYPQYQPAQYPSQVPVGYQGQGEPPLWAPWYDAPFQGAVRRFFKKYATFTGRASRTEYWWWTLVSVVVWTVLNIMTTLGSLSAPSSANGYTYTSPTPGPFTVIGSILLVSWGLAIIVPSLALTVRRLHDVNMSGWMVLLCLIPFVGGIAVLVFTLLTPKPEGQRFDVPTGQAPGTIYGR